jgi:pyruvate dehydrogenase E2 component (dihydrolipoamide acetyltransferase)
MVFKWVESIGETNCRVSAMHEVVMPRMDVTMQSGKIVQWLKKKDQTVTKGEPIVVVEGEKTTFEIESPDSGVLKWILHEEGSDVTVGVTIALVGAQGEEVPDRYKAKPPPDTQLIKAEPVAADTLTERMISQQVIASPAARSLARKHGIDLTQVKGTGRNGRIQAEDVLMAVESRSADGERSTLKVREVIQLKGIRKAVADRLLYSFHTTVPVLLTTEADFEALEETRKKTPSVSVTAFVVKAVAKALREHLIMNSSIEKDQVTVYDDINVAVAINTPDGLVAPVIEGAENKHLGEVSESISHLKDAALSGRLAVHELTSGTFTVTNLGGEGVELFAPIINPPQAAILALGRSIKKPVAVGDSVCIRPRAVMSLIFDHRVTDGVPAAKFLAHVKRLLEDPQCLLD